MQCWNLILKSFSGFWKGWLMKRVSACLVTWRQNFFHHLLKNLKVFIFRLATYLPRLTIFDINIFMYGRWFDLDKPCVYHEACLLLRFAWRAVWPDLTKICRFGEILKVCQFFEGLFYILQYCEPTWATFFAIWQKLIVVKGHKIVIII